MARCGVCGRRAPLTASSLGLCVGCIRGAPADLEVRIAKVHARSRQFFHLPQEAPRGPSGIRCDLCVRQCLIPPGEVGYCAVRQNAGGRLRGGSPKQGNLSWYYDPLPTNCVADWVCPAGTGAGHPRWAYRDGPEYGYKNLAVFYQACSFNCLGCQNWHYREVSRSGPGVSAAELAGQVDARTACICFFGGDPSPQLPHSLATSMLARRRAPGRVLRVCWETNGAMHPRLLRRAMRIALESGGCIKFDLKAWNDGVHRALTGCSNRRTLENFALAAEMARSRPDPPAVVVSTLLVPGYVDVEEVAPLARFIASFDPGIPYSLLAFHPQLSLHDLPVTSIQHAERALAAAKEAGLTRIHLGNRHLLGEPYELEQRSRIAGVGGQGSGSRGWSA